MKKLLLSSVLAGLLATSASAWDFCSTESQIAIDTGAMGTGMLIASATAGGVPGLIVGAVANQLLCNPIQEEATAIDSSAKTLVQEALKTNEIAGAKTVYFDYDKYTLNANAKEDTAVTAGAIKKIAEPIRIEGNADSRGSDEYNYALGLKRANAVKTELINLGVTNQLEVVSLGESTPACTTIESTEDCFAKNRRVDFKILK